MLYLIGENFEVIGKGEALHPNKKAGEFVLHTSIGKAALIEVAVANGVELKESDSEEKIVQKIEQNLKKKDVPTMSKESQKTEKEVKYEKIVKDGFEASKDDDAICVDLVAAGMKFKAASSFFKKTAEGLGLRITSKARMEQAVKLLEGFIPTSWEEVQKAAKSLSEKISDTSEAQAIAILRKVCKTAEKEFPKKPKGEKGGVSGFKAKADEWMLANKEATLEELTAFFAENDKGQRTNFINNTYAKLEFARKFVA